MSEHDEQGKHEELVLKAEVIANEATRIINSYKDSKLVEYLPSILGNAVAKLWAELEWDRDDLLDFVDDCYTGYAGIDDEDETSDNAATAKTIASISCN